MISPQVWKALSFEGQTPRDRIQVRVALDDGPWSDWSTTREATFAALPSGDHRLRVQAAGAAGARSEGEFTADFEVLPSLYSRPVFFMPVGASVMAVLLLSVLLVIRRRRDAAALAASEIRYRSFFQQAPISLWEQDYSEVKAYLAGLGLADEEAVRHHLTPRVVFECTGRIRILDANDATLELFECEDGTTLAAHLQEVFRREAYPALREGMVALHNGESRFTHETVAYSLKGTQRHVILNFAVVPGQKVEYSRVLVSVLDVTVQQQAAEEMRLAALAAEEANLAKSAFLANTSHEIRTPINAVMGMAQALQEEELTPRAADQVDTVLRASESLAKIIDDLLDLSKIEAGQLETVSLPFDLIEVVEGARSTLAPRADDKGIQLTFTADPTVPRYVEGDRVRLRQILLNLLGNAVKFTEQGSVDLSLKATVAEDEVTLYFEVRDTGIGIPEKHLEAVFDRFTQADHSITRSHGGTGLGLSITRSLVEAMAGSIHVESEPGVGSTFRFDIRVRPGTGLDLQATTTEATRVPPMRILLVEDNDLNRKVAQALLRRDDHNITEAENGVVAVDRFRADPPFDVILMDLQMPEMDGVTATERIRELETQQGLKQTSIVALTANVMQADRERCLQAGMDDFISKPVRKEDLRAALARLSAREQPEADADRPGEPPSENLPVLDPEPLEQLRELEASGDLDLAEFVDLFASTAPEILQRAKQAHEAGDLQTLHREVHTMKGTGREVGALQLTARAEFWEQRLKEGDQTNIEAGLEELGLLLETACTAVKAWSEAG
ncbi:MAG TPA: ATP-binding protein [Candidatus Latescibacteria bacterium]|nr:hypothetical protein [Gemmatimonadaceae bacterium]MDP6016126.1 ATP-binding protein [Candidatus Latescibacterota bacterium]HJP30068.1 ATP-binding protein [Candidatus Latescibacterota bacterium]